MAQAQTQALENQGNSGVVQHSESRLDISKLDSQSAHALQMLMLQGYFDKFATKEDLKNFATKSDLSDLRTEVFKEFGKVDKQFGELRGEIIAQRAEMKLLIYKLAGSIIGSVFLSAGGIIAFSH